MNAENENPDQSYSDQLSDFEGQLTQTMDDQSLLQDIHRTIKELLKEHRHSESDIRQLLSDAFESGTLREESFQLVQEMLDRIVIDDVDTLPRQYDRADEDEPEFGETDVIQPAVPKSDRPEERLQVGSILRDRFLLQQRVEGGSMGVVYKALDRRLAEVDGGDPWVAIKVLSPKLSRNANALRALQQEAVKGRCLSHPNIVRFLDLDRDDDLYFIVMEWLEGRSLAIVLDDAKSKNVDITTALDIVRQIADALDYAHRCGVVHADVKPGNVMITRSGNVKLFDFGIARIRQKQTDTVTKFDPSVLGATTPAYSSMQVLTGEEPVASDDVFSLGCLLYRLVAGYRVFGPRNAAEAAEAGMEPQRPKGLSDTQWKALKKALAYSRVARYATPNAFIDDLGLLDTDGRVEISIPDIAAQEVGVRPLWRSPVFVGAVAIAAGLAYIGLFTDIPRQYLSGPDADGNTAQFREAPSVTNVAGTPENSSGEVDRARDSTLDPVAALASNQGGITEGLSNTSASLLDGQSIAEITDREEISLLDEGPRGVNHGVELSATPGRVTNGSVDSQFAEDFSDVFVELPAAITAEASAPLPEAFQVPPERSTATHSLHLASSGSAIGDQIVTLQEGQGPAIIDLIRSEGIGVPMTVRITEVGFSGNQSPWSTGEYDIADNGIVEFGADQTTAQTRITVSSDSVSEPDRQASLLIRVSDAPESELAVINLTIEDDDRRAFEAILPLNTVAFSTGKVSVGENSPAVQIDVLRFNPGAQALDVDYVVRDITATESEDYFSPSVTTISFAPNQRTVRLLIPLVQDSNRESDETFSLEIVSGATNSEPNINRRITVMIRDDDSGAR